MLKYRHNIVQPVCFWVCLKDKAGAIWACPHSNEKLQKRGRTEEHFFNMVQTHLGGHGIITDDFTKR